MTPFETKRFFTVPSPFVDRSRSVNQSEADIETHLLDPSEVIIMMITSGCPQGTVLGCLAYVLYTNSLAEVLQDPISFKTYADDTKICAKVNNDDDARQLQNAINDFHRWTKSLDLKLSVEKCVVMHCGNGNAKHDHFIEGQRLKAVGRVLDLGVITTPDFC